MSKDELRQLLEDAYERGFQNGITAVELAIEDGLEYPDDSYSNVDETVNSILAGI